MRISLFIFVVLISLSCQAQTKKKMAKKESNVTEKVVKTDEEWKEQLSDMQYYVLRQQGTERPWTGEYNDHEGKGIYNCVACGNPLFLSEQKFESHCGWPSYYSYATDSSVIEKMDYSHGMTRVEIQCAKCEGHLGHVFKDGPAPTGLRYCINSAALIFAGEEKE